MAKTLVEKLFIKPSYRIAVLNAPEAYLSTVLVELPGDVVVAEALDGTFDLIQYFTRTWGELEPAIEGLKAGLKAGAPIWFCYPKGGDKARIPTDLNRDKLWSLLTPFGFTPNHQIAIDETWSALRFKTVG